MIQFLILLLLHFCSLSFPEKHSLKFGITASSGLKEFEIVAEVDGTMIAYCDNKILTPNYDWVKKMFDNYLLFSQILKEQCFEILPDVFDNWISGLKDKQPEAYHVLQRMDLCSWDDETGDTQDSMQYAYDGKDVNALDLKTMTWISQKPTELPQDPESYLVDFYMRRLPYPCTQWLLQFLYKGHSSLQRKDFPTVSILQRTPSSTVRCHATGFYPKTGLLFWRKDEQETHEHVIHGEILPNEDGSFQMTVDLNVSAVSVEDWKLYDCVFHFSHSEDKIITKLNDGIMRTNKEEKPSSKIIAIIVAVIVFVIAGVAAASYLVYKKIKERQPEFSPVDVSLNPAT